ncbi:aminoglycoside phosphotransferase family protein [Burkholderia sp. Ac-20344]|uniref:aminoglycoside phosphotransferase family protein n=1 Tax=Burkholderia sp. Ac-20344 TaxID=2703890 RepID=UPI00197C5610|nr:aminoglycoside phosphotransferase family protein [Burkholderia sp. Ac-20344]MBN3833715.1 aminoglycoside phosphotransferase family protein [Burkholderia sp. Ac-20344]
MKDPITLKKLVGADDLRPIVEREGTVVYEASSQLGRFFVKATTNRAAFDRHCEILEELESSLLVPKILNKLAWEDYSVVVLSAISGSRLDHTLKNVNREEKLRLVSSAGSALGQLHRTISPTRLLEMKFWQQRDGVSERPVEWNAHLEEMVSKWKSRLNKAATDYLEYSNQLDQLLQLRTDLREPANLKLLHCDYIGRNILATSKGHVSGILDFEAARIGDAAYDLAKLVWVDIDFSDEELRNSFLSGWEDAYGEQVPRREFLYYVGVQCLAAIAWTDKNKPLDGANAFRSAAIQTLRIVTEIL